MQHANALHEALESALMHVTTLAQETKIVREHKDLPCVVYVCVALCVHTLQSH